MPEEQSRQKFLAGVTLAVGGVTALSLAVPLGASLIPESLLRGREKRGAWIPLSRADVDALAKSTGRPVRVTFSFERRDGYLSENDAQFLWGVKLNADQVASFRKTRPDLFAHEGGKLDYPAVVMDFVLFSSICPHLGGRVQWHPEAQRFICPLHGSQYGIQGERLAGPAPRGLDPLPLRLNGTTAEITWIQYKSQTPDRIVVSYS